MGATAGFLLFLDKRQFHSPSPVHWVHITLPALPRARTHCLAPAELEVPYRCLLQISVGLTLFIPLRHALGRLALFCSVTVNIKPLSAHAVSPRYVAEHFLHEVMSVGEQRSMYRKISTSRTGEVLGKFGEILIHLDYVGPSHKTQPLLLMY